MKLCWTLVVCIAFIFPVFRAQDCPFIPISGHIITRGAVSTQDATPQACEQSCRNNSSCQSYQLDYNPGHQLCWIQLGENAFLDSNKYIDNNITEYKKNTSCSACYPDFNATTNIVTFGAVLYSNITNQQDCKALCVGLPSCLSYQIDLTQPSSLLCWIQLTKGDSFLRPGVTEYTKFFICPNTTGCTPIFTTLSNGIATPGATPKPQLTSNDSCRQACSSDLQCFSYQIDTNQNPQAYCWLQTDNQKIINKNFNSRPGVSEYVKDTTYCLYSTVTSTIATTATTTTVPPCAYTFETRQPNYASGSATAASMFATNETCRLACLVSSSCVSYQLDLNPGSTLCWHQFNNNSQIYLRLNVIEYLKVCPSQTTSPSVTTSSSVCPPIFNNLTTNIASIGAISRQDIASPQACRDLCVSLPSCVSYQIDNSLTRSSLCWIQTNPNNLAPENLFSRPNVFEYVKNTTYCLFSTTTQICPPSFNEPRPIYVSAQATPRADIVIEDDCRNLCLSTAGCLSYQIDHTIDRIALCWIQTNAFNLEPGNLILRPGVIEYVKNTTYCLYSTMPSTGTTCNIIFLQQTPGGASINAIPNATFPNSDSCRMSCLYDSKCLSYQLNSNSNQVLCWLQFDQNSLSGPRYAQPGVTEFIKSCQQNSTSTSTAKVSTSSSTCNVQYKANPPNQGSLGAQSINAVTFVDCQAACTADSTCVSFQINSAQPNPYCWLQKNANALQQFYLRPNVTEYLKYCADTSTTVPTCVNTFEPFRPGQTTLSAQLQPYATEDLCRGNCLVDPTCLSYQINSNPNAGFCWFQKNAASFNQLYFQSGIQEFKKVCLAPQTTATAAPCAVTYEQGPPNTASIRATPISSLTTNDQCQQACTQDIYCLSYQINSRPNEVKCWLQRSPNLGDLYYQENVIEYIKKSNCSATESTTISTMTSTTTAATTAITTIATTTTTPATCSIIYQVPNPGYLSLYAVQRSTLTAATCEGNCTSDPTCKSYQIVGNECWQQLNSAYLINIYYTDGLYFEYVKICVRDCVRGINFVESIYGFVSRGAEERPLLNEVQCRDACQIDVDCKSYQIERSSGTPVCWLQRGSSPFLESNLYQKYPAITEYRKVCGTWPVSPSSTSTSTSTTTSTTTSSPSSPVTPRTTPQPRITTPAKSNTTSATTTTTTTSPFPRMNTTSGSTSTTTTSISTTTGCQTIYTWSSQANSNMAGGIFNRATTEDGCRDACISLDACVGVDIDRNYVPLACYLLIKSVPLTFASGVTHYDLVRNQQGCTSGTPTTTQPVVPTTCSTAVKSLGMNADAGMQVASSVSEEECLRICTNDPTCVAADYNVGSRTCYLHSDPNGVKANKCCLRYSICKNSSNRPSQCSSTFSSFTDRSPDLQSRIYQMSGSQSDCSAACLLRNCTIFTYTSATSTCEFYSESTDIGEFVGKTLFIRNFCLNNVDLPTPTTATTLPTPAPGECPIDLLLVLDNSGSINENTDIDNWELLKNFAQSIVSKAIRYSYYLDHVAIVTFSESANVAFDFKKYYSNINELMAAIKSLSFAGSRTNIPAALNLGRRLFQDPTYGSRTNAIKVMILITDGQITAEWLSNFPIEVSLLSNTNIKRFAVGVGSQINLNQLTQYASPGGVATTSSFQTIGNTFTSLSLFVNQFSCTSVIQTQLSSSSTQTSSSTTTTSTSTTTTTTASRVPTPPSTLRPTPVDGNDCTFGLALKGSMTGLPRPYEILANRLNGWVSGSDSCRVGLNQSKSIVEICAGIPGGQTVELQTSGGFPSPISFQWLATDQSGVETGCRSAVVSLSSGASISLQLNRGNVYSSEQQAGWSSFSISNTIFDESAIFSGYSLETYSDYSVIRFPNPSIQANGLFNTAENTYECRNNAFYYFTFSAGVPAGQTAMLTLENLNKTYSAQRLYSRTNGLTTISRSILVPCNSRVKLALQFGSINSGSDGRLISFSAFPYNPKYGVIAAWAAYRSGESREADPLSFDDWVINKGIRLSDMATVYVSMNGYYYVYVSIGTDPLNTSKVTLRRNGIVVFTVERRWISSTGIDVLGRGVVIQLNQNDQIRVVVESGSSITSSTNGYQTSFFGFFLGA